MGNLQSHYRRHDDGTSSKVNSRHLSPLAAQAGGSNGGRSRRYSSWKEGKQLSSVTLSDLNEAISLRDLDYVFEEQMISADVLPEDALIEHYFPPTFPINPVLTPDMVMLCRKSWLELKQSYYCPIVNQSNFSRCDSPANIVRATKIENNAALHSTTTYMLNSGRTDGTSQPTLSLRPSTPPPTSRGGDKPTYMGVQQGLATSSAVGNLSTPPPKSPVSQIKASSGVLPNTADESHIAALIVAHVSSSALSSVAGTSSKIKEDYLMLPPQSFKTASSSSFHQSEALSNAETEVEQIRSTAMLQATNHAVPTNADVGEDRGKGIRGLAVFHHEFYSRLLDRAEGFEKAIGRDIASQAAVLKRFMDFVTTLDIRNMAVTQLQLEGMGRHHCINRPQIRPWMYSVYAETAVSALAHVFDKAHVTFTLMNAWTHLMAFVLRGMLPAALNGRIARGEGILMVSRSNENENSSPYFSSSSSRPTRRSYQSHPKTQRRQQQPLQEFSPTEPSSAFLARKRQSSKEKVIPEAPQSPGEVILEKKDESRYLFLEDCSEREKR